MGIEKGRPIIRKDALGDPESTKNVVSDKVGYGWPDGSLEAYCFEPLCVAFCSSEDSDVASRR